MGFEKKKFKKSFRLVTARSNDSTINRRFLKDSWRILEGFLKDSPPSWDNCDDWRTPKRTRLDHPSQSPVWIPSNPGVYYSFRDPFIGRGPCSIWRILLWCAPTIGNWSEDEEAGYYKEKRTGTSITIWCCAGDIRFKVVDVRPIQTLKDKTNRFVPVQWRSRSSRRCPVHYEWNWYIVSEGYNRSSPGDTIWSIMVHKCQQNGTYFQFMAGSLGFLGIPCHSWSRHLIGSNQWHRVDQMGTEGMAITNCYLHVKFIRFFRSSGFRIRWVLGGCSDWVRPVAERITRPLTKRKWDCFWTMWSKPTEWIRLGQLNVIRLDWMGELILSVCTLRIYLVVIKLSNLVRTDINNVKNSVKRHLAAFAPSLLFGCSKDRSIEGSKHRSIEKDRKGNLCVNNEITDINSTQWAETLRLGVQLGDRSIDPSRIALSLL